MSTLTVDSRAQILASEATLLAYAGRLTSDEREARDLVQLTLKAALEDDGRFADGDSPVSDTRLFGLLRGVFHSVARRRSTQRERGSVGRLWQPDRAEAFANPAIEASEVNVKF